MSKVLRDRTPEFGGYQAFASPTSHPKFWWIIQNSGQRSDRSQS
jgi:hypothetical protein